VFDQRSEPRLAQEEVRELGLVLQVRLAAFHHDGPVAAHPIARQEHVGHAALADAALDEVSPSQQGRRSGRHVIAG
jgi:hypothetical protein